MNYLLWLIKLPLNVYDILLFILLFIQQYRIRSGGVMVRMLTLSAVDREFARLEGKTKNYKSEVCCFSSTYTTLTRKSKDWMAQDQQCVCKRSDMSTRGLVSVS